jgi:flagellar motor component MotA
MAEKKRKSFTVSLDEDVKEEIEDEFLKHKIKNYTEGYRALITLGFEQFKKKGGKISG